MKDRRKATRKAHSPNFKDNSSPYVRAQIHVLSLIATPSRDARAGVWVPMWGAQDCGPYKGKKCRSENRGPCDRLGGKSFRDAPRKSQCSWWSQTLGWCLSTAPWWSSPVTVGGLGVPLTSHAPSIPKRNAASATTPSAITILVFVDR